jgi:hypothetical protein
MSRRILGVVVSVAIGWLLLHVWGRGPTRPSVPNLAIVNCPLHGIAYDADREVCPSCAKGPSRPL